MILAEYQAKIVFYQISAQKDLSTISTKYKIKSQNCIYRISCQKVFKPILAEYQVLIFFYQMSAQKAHKTISIEYLI